MLSDDDRHHLERALRLRVGDPLTVTDGAGRWRSCRLAADGVTPDAEVVTVIRSHPSLTVGLALTKSGKPELAVQKLTELGIDRVVVFASERSVVRWDDEKTIRQQSRLERIAHEAVMQSRGVWLPEVQVGTTFRELVGGPGAVLADRTGEPLGSADHTVLIGPEGGWSADERRLATRSVVIGSNVLRSETAAIAAGTLLSGLRSALVVPAG